MDKTPDINLGQISQVAPRSIWGKEDRNFTSWLAENIDQLVKALNMQLEDPETEVSVGSFHADIICSREDSDSRVLEDQLKPTDHGHLGQLIT